MVLNKKLLFAFVLGIFLISLASASLGTFRKGDCVQLHQICDNCTYVNLTSVIRVGDNATVWNIGETMTKTSFDYNYTFCNASEIGGYNYNTCGDQDGAIVCENINFYVTGTGAELNESNSRMYSLFLILVIFLFIVDLVAIPMLPNKNTTDEEGVVLSINNLKYMRSLCWFLAWVLLMAIMFLSSGIALAYEGIQAFGNLLFVLYRIMFLMTLPIVLLWLIMIFINVFKDKETKNLIERGVTIRE